MRDRPVLWALLVTAAFMAARFGVRVALPPATDLHTWLLIDAWKTIPRLGALAACWWAMRPAGPRAWGWTAPSGAGAALAFAACFALGLKFLDNGPGDFGAGEKAVGVLLTIPVALWEELCYRGLLFQGLRREMSALRAALISTAVFTVMHWGSIGVAGWPEIYLTGFVWCGAAALGAGLPALAVSHWLVDSVWFWLAEDGHGGTFTRLSLALLAAAAVPAWRALRATPGAPPSPTRPE
ncbi:MAG: CPBP family intramembrane metalloprotease [Elusimicrobiota bacterium]|nr:MAG: CPBP family intramembrane metalloprotease [Elusimicrobiota bacterium]